MDRDELLARMLATLNDKLTPREMEALICAGADFYRTLARAEQYRQASIWSAPP